MGGAPSVREESVYAAWLSLIPNRQHGVSMAAERVPVAMGATAAWLQELGEIGPEPLEFCCGKRRQTQREGLTVHKRAIKARDIVYVGGIPATSPPLTVIDLIDGGEDLSLVANVLKDAFGRGLVPDVGGLASEVDRRSRRVGLPKGTSLYSLLVEER